MFKGEHRKIRTSYTATALRGKKANIKDFKEGQNVKLIYIGERFKGIVRAVTDYFVVVQHINKSGKLTYRTSFTKADFITGSVTVE